MAQDEQSKLLVPTKQLFSLQLSEGPHHTRACPLHNGISISPENSEPIKPASMTSSLDLLSLIPILNDRKGCPADDAVQVPFFSCTASSDPVVRMIYQGLTGWHGAEDNPCLRNTRQKIANKTHLPDSNQPSSENTSE